MKHFLKVAFALILVIAALCGIMSLTSCHRVSPQEKAKQFAKQVQAYNNPEFASFEDAVVYQELMREEFLQDSVFRCISKDILEKVTTVLSNTGSKLSKRTIAHQYLDSKKVFDNIEPKPNPKPVEKDSTTIVELKVQENGETK